MALTPFEELHQHADARTSAIPVVVAGGADTTVLEALAEARSRGWVEPIVVGPESVIAEMAEECGVDLDGFRVLDVEPDAIAAAEVAVAEVRQGRAKLLMKGRIRTPDLLRAVLDPALGLRTGRVICQVVLMEVMRDARRFLLADAGICVAPSVDERIDILNSVVELARALGSDEPKVALLAATETVHPAMPETGEAADLQRRHEAGEFPGCRLQGPLSFDLAYAADAGEKKRIGGPVVGAADIFLFPNLLAANLTVKAIMDTADCKFGGILRGTSAPVVFMSRADSTATRLNSLALALASLA